MELNRIVPAGTAFLLAAMMALASPLAPSAFAMGGTDDTTDAQEEDAAGGEGEAAAASEEVTPAAGDETTTAATPATSDEATPAASEGDTAETPSDCPSGFKLNAETNKCEQSSSGIIRELPAIGWAKADPAFVEAAVLAHSGRYEAAIAAFTSLARPDDPYVLNYLGFANRKLGRAEAALGYYARALAIRPDYVRAREYLGEGYLALGRIDEAKHQLALIAAQCGRDCDAYRSLHSAIDGTRDTTKG